MESRAHDINNAGQVVGDALTSSGATHAFITGPHGEGMRDLGGFRAFGLNEAGEVIGINHGGYGFITGRNGINKRELGTLGGEFTVPIAINAEGQVVGWSMAIVGNNQYQRAFITGPGGLGMTDLGTLGGDSSVAAGINAAGQVVGWALPSDRTMHVFITGPDGVGMRDLGTLGGSDARGLDINDLGQVVGFSSTPSGLDHAFITNPAGTGLIDLNSLVNLPSGVTLTRAEDINNVGQVIAIGIPEPESYAMFLAGLGLIGFMVWRERLIAEKRLKSGVIFRSF